MLQWLIAVALAQGGPSPEASSSVVLHWNAPASCPDAAEARRRLDAHLAEWSPAAGERHVVDVAITPRDEALVAEVRVETPRGTTERSIRASHCEAVADGAVLVAAVAISPVAALTSPPPDVSPPPAEPEPEPEPQPELAEQVPEPPAPEPGPERAADRAPESIASPPRQPRSATATRDRPSRRVRGLVMATSGLTVGITPRPTLAAGLGLGLRTPRFRFVVDGRGLVPATTSTGDGPQARVRGWLVGAHGCWVPAWGLIELPLCAGFAAGQALGEGIGVDVSRTARRTLVTIDGLAAVALRVDPHLALMLGVRGFGVPQRARFEVQGAGEVYRVRGGGVEPFLGLEVDFP